MSIEHVSILKTDNSVRSEIKYLEDVAVFYNLIMAFITINFVV